MQNKNINIFSRRQTDAIVTVCKDNESKVLSMIALNNVFAKMVGYSGEELLEQNVGKIFPFEINQILQEEVEFSDNDQDLAILLNRIAKFFIVTKDGKKIPVKIKAFSSVSDGKYLYYDLLITDISVQLEIAKIRATLSDGRSDSDDYDIKLGLMTKDAFLRDLRVVAALSGKRVKFCFALIKVDNSVSLRSSLGVSIFMQLIKEIGGRIADITRRDDMVGYLGDDQIGVILFNCGADNARIALNRIRWQLMTQPVVISNDNATAITVSASYKEIDSKYNPDVLINACAKAIANASDDQGNKIYQA